MWMKGITGQVLTSATSGFTAKLNLSGCILLIKKKKSQIPNLEGGVCQCPGVPQCVIWLSCVLYILQY